jgi:hypothetical protein
MPFWTHKCIAGWTFIITCHTVVMQQALVCTRRRWPELRGEAQLPPGLPVQPSHRRSVLVQIKQGSALHTQASRAVACFPPLFNTISSAHGRQQRQAIKCWRHPRCGGCSSSAVERLQHDGGMPVSGWAAAGARCFQLHAFCPGGSAGSVSNTACGSRLVVLCGIQASWTCMGYGGPNIWLRQSHDRHSSQPYRYQHTDLCSCMC